MPVAASATVAVTVAAMRLSCIEIILSKLETYWDVLID
jgi:hypothetical protein